MHCIADHVCRGAWLLTWKCLMLSPYDALWYHLLIFQSAWYGLVFNIFFMETQIGIAY